MWGEMYPDLMDGLVPIASQPIGISGRNWIIGASASRRSSTIPISTTGFTRRTRHIGSTPRRPGPWARKAITRFQLLAPTREAGDAMYKNLVEEASKADANNTLYGIEAVMDYDPSKDLEKIKARLMAINSADDEAIRPRCM